VSKAQAFDLAQRGFGFHALGHQRIAYVRHQAGEIGHHLAGAVVVSQFVHQRYIELDHIHRQVDQIAQRRIAGAEIVHCDTVIHGAQQLEIGVHRIDLRDERSLRDFKHQGVVRIVARQFQQERGDIRAGKALCGQVDRDAASWRQLA